MFALTEPIYSNEFLLFYSQMKTFSSTVLCLGINKAHLPHHEVYGLPFEESLYFAENPFLRIARKKQMLSPATYQYMTVSLRVIDYGSYC